MENTLLNLVPASYLPEVHLSQYDVGRELKFTLKDGSSDYTVPSGAVVTVKATKPSGLGFVVNAVAEGSVVTLSNTETMTNENGRFPAELSITQGSTVIGTSNFIFNIERSPHPEGTIDGDAESLLPELTLLVERIENSNARIESMTASATTLPTGEDATAEYDSVNNQLILGLPKGEKGEQGEGVASLEPRVSANQNAINVLSARMDTFASLPEGSTTGDAELTDIRVDVDGKTHASAGAAVRSQVANIQNGIEEYTRPSVNLWNVKWERGSFAWGDGTETDDSEVIRTDDFIEVEPSTQYTFYDGRDWSKTNYNLTYPVQYVFEYAEDGTFIKQSAIYTLQFTTGENTHKVKFRSSGDWTNVDIDAFNAVGMILEQRPTYRSYESPFRKLVVDEKFEGVKSSNLFNGIIFDKYINDDIGQVEPNSSALMVSTDWIDVSKDEYSTIYASVGNEYLPFYYCFCYDSNYDYLGRVTGVTVDESFRIIQSYTLKNGTKHVILTTSGLPNNATNLEKINALKSVAKDKLFVTTDLEMVYAQNGIDGSNKVNGKLAKNGLLKEIRNENIRPFVLSALDSYAEDIIENGYDATISVMTDIHTPWLEPYAILNYMANSGAVDCAVNLGDNVPDHYDTKAETKDFLRKVFNAQNQFTTKTPVYNAMGNHDVNPVNGSNISDGTNMIRLNEFYSLAQERTAKGMLAGKCYGYYDIENAKIRVIILNTSDIYDANGTPLISGYNTAIQSDQFEWFCDTALDLTDKKDVSEWAVITMAHDKLDMLTNGAIGEVLNAFASGSTASINTSYTVNDHTFNFVKNVDYTNQGAVEYIGHFCGHSHDDNISAFATNFKQVETACAIRPAHYIENGTRKDYTRTPDTVQEQLFDTICINRKTKTVIMKRFGVGSDRTFTY